LSVSVASILKHAVPGLVIVAVGCGMLVLGQDYALGTLRRIGPGFFPTVIAAFLIGIGLVIAVEDNIRPEPADRVYLRPVLIVTAAIICWSLTIERFGFAPATFLLILVSSFAEDKPDYIRVLTLATALTLIGYLIFVTGFGLPFSFIRF